jgi:hypothetical protein
LLSAHLQQLTLAQARISNQQQVDVTTDRHLQVKPKQEQARYLRKERLNAHWT